MTSPEEPEKGSEFEAEHVHQVYDEIASHFSSTRFKPWPVVDDFLKSLPAGTVGLDVGCGNGKYLTVRKDVFILASDRSQELLKYATRHPPHSAVVADTLSLPHPDNSFDFAICIAVIHHLSTPQRRQEGIRRILDALRPPSPPHNADQRGQKRPYSRTAVAAPGRALIFVWALEQKNSRRGWDTGMQQDVMVPWVLKTEHDKIRNKSPQQKDQIIDGNEATKVDSRPPATEDRVFHRYYHLYREGELERDIVSAGGRVVNQGYDRDNWWAICERTN